MPDRFSITRTCNYHAKKIKKQYTFEFIGKWLPFGKKTTKTFLSKNQTFTTHSPFKILFICINKKNNIFAASKKLQIEDIATQNPFVCRT